MKKNYLFALTFAFMLPILLALAFTPKAMAESPEPHTSPAKVYVGVWLVNVEKVDLAASSYRLDFYLWFRFNPSEISLVDVRARIKEAEAPSKEEIEKLKADIEKEKRKKAELQKRLGEMRVKLENVVNTWKNCLIN